MKKRTRLCCLVVSVFVFHACSNKSLSPEEYGQEIKNNKNLNKVVSVGDLDYTFRIVPPELLALKSATDEQKHVDVKKYLARLKELNGYLFVNIEIQLHDGTKSHLKYKLSSRSEYEQRVMYYEFYAKDDVKLHCEGTDIAPKSYQFENHLDLMPYNTLIVAFPECAGEEDIQVVFNDRALNNLFVKANFGRDEINRIPKLNLN
jgi:hypothetical protein